LGIDSREIEERYAAFLQQIYTEFPEPDASADAQSER
jgi:hypothetical protein